MNKSNEIIEGNRAIALFRGWTMITNPGELYWLDENQNIVKDNTDMVCKTSTLMFDTDWNWIMESCRKFDNLDMFKFSEDERKEYSRHCDMIDEAVTDYEPWIVFLMLQQACKWYNNLFASKSFEQFTKLTDPSEGAGIITVHKDGSKTRTDAIHKIHDHPVMQGLRDIPYKNVIVDYEFGNLFSRVTKLDDEHIVVSRREYENLKELERKQIK